ncbi:hypothetical protein AB1E18_017892 [Capra hircus]
MRPASTCSVPNATTGSGPGMVRRAMFYKPQEPGFYSVAAPAGPGCGHPSRGSPEGPVCHPKEHYLTLWNHKGFVRLALRHGAFLVPVYSFGENDIFRKDSINCVCSRGPSPTCAPVPAAGRPIPVPHCPQPTEEQVDHYHRLYMKALEQLFEEL